MDAYDHLMSRINNPALQREHEMRQQVAAADQATAERIERGPSYSEQSLASITSLVKGIDMGRLSDADAAFVFRAIENNASDHATMARLQKLYGDHNGQGRNPDGTFKNITRT